VSRTTYERLKAFCETNNISMSQLVETRVNDFLGAGDVAPMTPSVPLRPLAPRPMMAMAPPPKPVVESRPVHSAQTPAAPAVMPIAIPPAPMTSAAARFVVEPPPPIIKPRQDTAAPKPAEKRPEQIFTF
jgi:hypothetical protein